MSEMGFNQPLFKLTVSEIPQDVKFKFENYAENKVMSAENLQRFLFQEQKSSVTVQDARSIIDGTKHLHVLHRGGLNLEDFFKFLFSDQNSPISPNSRAHQDMNCPLPHYFIYTGHNSYLTWNQLSSDYSDVPITQALLTPCECN